MLDQSFITFSTQRSLPSVFNTSSHHLDHLFAQFENLLDDIQCNSMLQSSMVRQLLDLLSKTKLKVEETRIEGMESRRKCLERIEILLYQRDYDEALKKIDYYKSNPTVDPSVQISISEFDDSPLPTYREHYEFTFDEAISIVENQFTSFEEKHEAWLSVMMHQDSQESSLHHVTYQDVEKAQLEKFKQEFSIHESRQNDSTNSILLQTPKKKNVKSMICLKNSNGRSAHCKKSQGKHKSKEEGKSPSFVKIYNTGNKKSCEKKTVKKSGVKEAQDHKTSKKTTPFLF